MNPEPALAGDTKTVPPLRGSDSYINRFTQGFRPGLTSQPPPGLGLRQFACRVPRPCPSSLRTRWEIATLYATLPAQSTHKRRSGLNQNRPNVRGRISLVAETPERRRRGIAVSPKRSVAESWGRLVLRIPSRLQPATQRTLPPLRGSSSQMNAHPAFRFAPRWAILIPRLLHPTTRKSGA